MDLATVDHLLTTTRAVRKRLDLERPVEPEVLERCIEIALQAPSGSNRQGWHFVVVTDPAKRRALADLYRRSFRAYAASNRTQPPPEAAADRASVACARLRHLPVRALAQSAGTGDPLSSKGAPSMRGCPRKPACTAQSSPLPGRSCWRSGRAVSERRGRRSTSSTSARRQQSWTYPKT